MGLSVLDWVCPCCKKQFNPAMETVGLGDGKQYARRHPETKEPMKVCKTCRHPKHKVPCQTETEL